MRRMIYFAAALALLVGDLGNARADPIYRVQYLGFSFVNGLDAAINNHGQIVGRVPGLNGILYSDGQITVIDSLGSPSGSSPAAINDAGLVGGRSNLVGGTPHGFLYDNGSLTDLGALPAFPQSRVNELNEAGDVVGASLINAGTTSRAVLWRNGTITDLGSGTANAINELGSIVGTSGNTRAVLFQNGGMVDLGDFGDSPLTQAIDINDRGQIVGQSSVRLPSGAFAAHPFLYEAGVWRDLGLPTGVPLGIPRAINNRGDIVGNSNSSLGSSNRPPFVYTDGVIYNLQTLLDDSGAGLNLQLVYDINDSGVILAQGRLPNSYQAVLLIPVPEPTTLALAAIGLVAFVARARRDRKAASSTSTRSP
jgi:probable HAF family extracellular repeat protein